MTFRMDVPGCEMATGAFYDSEDPVDFDLPFDKFQEKFKGNWKRKVSGPLWKGT